MSIKICSVVAAAILACVFVEPVSATPVTITTSSPLNFVDLAGVNPIGVGTPIGTTGYYSGSTRDFIGFQSVSPYAGTSIVATQGNSTVNIAQRGTPAFPTQYDTEIPFNASTSLLGAWTLTLTNSTASNSPLVEMTHGLPVTTPSVPVTGISLSGDKLAPTLNWTVPPNSTATADTIFVFKIGAGGTSQSIYSSGELSATTTSYSIPTGVLQSGGEYSVSIQSDIRDSTTQSIEARTRAFTAAFSASAGTFTSSVYLPVVASTPSTFGGPVYDFTVPVTAGQPIIIDPAIATGYIYQTGTGDPNFASVLLPDIGNPSPYSLYLWNGTAFVFDTLLAANTLFSFGGSGVSEFEVLGISAGDFLDPNNVSAFMTQLTFVGDGTFTGTMTPIIASVPEPSSIALFGVAMLGLVAAKRKSRATRA